MKKEEKKEFEALSEQIVKLMKRIDRHNIERKRILAEKKRLRKAINDLEKKYDDKNGKVQAVSEAD